MHSFHNAARKTKTCEPAGLAPSLECFEEAKGSEGLVWRVLSAFAVFVAAYFKGKDAFGRWWNVKVAKQF